MATPPLYKYLSVQGAKLTLENRTLRHAKPSDFNDVEDLTIQSIFPEELGTALKILENGFVDVVLEHLNDTPTCDSPTREKVLLIQKAFRENPDAVGIARSVGLGDKPIFDIEYMCKRVDAQIIEINNFMQDYRVLCVTTHLASESMWTEYAENHKGIAIRIEPNLAKDSKLRLFQPVTYREKRPSLYDDTLDFIAQGFFGNAEERNRAILEKIVYSKTLKWQHEGEYRLAIPLRTNETPFDTLSYHPEEITELYLGLAMEAQEREVIIDLAKTINPAIAVFQTKRVGDNSLSYERV